MTSDIERAIAALRDGLVVGFPTDTVYGIAADPFDPHAVARIFEAKGRPEKKPLPVLAASAAALAGVCVLGEFPEAVTRHWPGGLTVVVPRAPGLATGVGDPTKATVAVRIPDHPVALDLLGAAGPLAVTSANPSGDPPATDDSEARETLGSSVAVYLPGDCPGGSASTVVDLTVPGGVVLRSGPVAWRP